MVETPENGSRHNAPVFVQPPPPGRWLETERAVQSRLAGIGDELLDAESRPLFVYAARLNGTVGMLDIVIGALVSTIDARVGGAPPAPSHHPGIVAGSVLDL